MYGKKLICFFLLALLVIASLDSTDACKKCGQSYCNCLPGGHGLLHHGLGHHGYGLPPPPLFPPPSICLPPPPPPPAIGYDLSYPPPGLPAYPPPLPAYPPPPLPAYPQPSLCSLCGGYSHHGFGLYPKKRLYRPRCRCY